MVLMALDHVRDFFYADLSFDPTDLQKSPPSLFLVRWVTHFCAPAFVLLAGTGTTLSLLRGRPRGQQAWFLVTRGLWLVFLELFVIRSIGWFFNWDLTYLPAWVLWALGWSMVLLAPLLWLPAPVAGLLGVGLIVGQHFWVAIPAGTFGSLEPLWIILADPKPLLVLGRFELAVGYPLLPWFGVMLMGYTLGWTYGWPSRTRRLLLIFMGVACLLVFLTLRLLVQWSDPASWQRGQDTLRQFLAVLNCTKQPPSLCFLLMTLGPTLLVLAATENARGGFASLLITFGRVPFFYYLLHLPLVHGLACLLCWWQVGQVQPWLTSNPEEFWNRPGYGVGVAGLLLVWLLVVALLYPACAWFADLKARKRWAILSYL